MIKYHRKKDIEELKNKKRLQVTLLIKAKR